MALILNRVRPAALYDARAQRYRILKTARVKRCGLCTLDIPEADIIVEHGVPGSEGAIERCPMCKDVLTAEWLSAEEQSVAAVKAAAFRALFQPPQVSMRPLQETIPGAVTSITTASGATVSQSAPLMMAQATPTTLYLNGQRLSATDIISYSTGITDSSAPVVTATQITLSLTASAAGRFNVLFNNHTYRNIVLVR